MRFRILAAAAAVVLASCAPVQGLYETAPGDAAQVYRSLVGRFPPLPATIQDAFEGKPTKPVELYAALRVFFDVLDELRIASYARECNWTYAAPPLNSAVPRYDFVLPAAKVLKVRADLFFRKGVHDLALDDMFVLLKLGSDLLHDHGMMQNLQGLIVLTWAGDSLSTWICKARLAGPELELVEAHLRHLVRRFPGYERWLRSERASAPGVIDLIQEVGLEATMERMQQGPPSKPLAPSVLMMHEWTRDVILKDPERARLAIFRRWDDLVARAEEDVQRPLNSQERSLDLEKLRDGLPERTVRHRFASRLEGDDVLQDVADLLFVLWAPGTKTRASHETTRLYLQMMLLACRLEIARLRTGAYPEDLKGIGQEIRDPYDGRILRYRRIVQSQGEGYVAVSAGEKDDAERRIEFIQECQFDWNRYEQGENERLTFWAFHRR